MKKKFLVLMMSFAMVMAMTACGGSEEPAADNTDTTAEEPAAEPETEGEAVSAEENDEAGEVELVMNEANGLKIGLPAEFAAADGGVEGLAVFANEDSTAFVTISGPAAVDESTNTDQLTEEMFAAMFEAGGYGDVAVDNVGTVEQPDGATAVAAFGTGSMEDGNFKVNIVMQYYFTKDSNEVYVVNYVYPLEDTATDDVITNILASVTAE